MHPESVRDRVMHGQRQMRRSSAHLHRTAQARALGEIVPLVGFVIVLRGVSFAPGQFRTGRAQFPDRRAPVPLRHGRSCERMPLRDPVQSPRQCRVFERATKREVVAVVVKKIALGWRQS